MEKQLPLTQKCELCGAVIPYGMLNLVTHFEKEHPSVLKYEPMTMKQLKRMLKDYDRF